MFVALRKESVDRNPAFVDTDAGNLKSLSARRAWIEIPFIIIFGVMRHVALRKESVDRNFNRHCPIGQHRVVALRKESVDRNLPHWPIFMAMQVALRKESVDRNRPTIKYRPSVGRSLSARRAWIEIRQFGR